MLFVWYVTVIAQFFLCVNAKWAVDVDSSIINEIQQNPTVGYLIKFHAPWCGHCRHFESAYEEIAKDVNELSANVEELKNIRVVRVDATVYSDVANYYGIRGYPTIKFIRGSQVLTYENERTKPAVLNFLKRVNGPILRWISSVENFDEIRREHEVFFLHFTKTTNENDRLFKDYEDIINRYISQAYFYATNDSTLEQTYFSKFQSDEQSQVFAIKKDGFYLYKPTENDQNLEDFILREKVSNFPQIAAGNMYDLVMTKKIMIIYGFDDQQEKSSVAEKLKSHIKSYMTKHDSTLHDTFQFAWSNDLELLSNIAVWTVEAPLLFLYDHNKRKYGIYLLSSVMDGSLQLEPILDYVVANSSQLIRHTGNTWSKRLFRPFWELYRTIMAMFIESPLLSMLIMGLPASVLSVVCYCVCCLPNETFMDDPEYSYQRGKDEETIEQDQLPTLPDDGDQKPMVEKKTD